MDNGRTRVLADEVGRQALHCIRCSACLNVCPVYSRTGGHAYGSVYPGPIGAILVPQLRRRREREVAALRLQSVRSLLRGLSVKIDIPSVLLHLRAEVVRKAGPSPERAAMRGLARVFGSARRYQRAQRLARLVQRPARRLPGPLSKWRRTRELQPVPKESFRDWWRGRRLDGARGAEVPALPAPEQDSDHSA